MKKILIVLGMVLFFLFPHEANAQSQRNPCYYSTSSSTGCISVSGTNPLPVTASATISGGFTDAATGTPISVTTGGVTGTLPAGTVVAAFNVGTTNAAYCKLGASATTSDIYLAPGGGWFAFQVGANTQLTCITSTSTTTVNMVGGSGLPTGSGGGSGGGGGGGAVTIADGANVVEGALADAAVTAGATGSVSAKLRSISRDVMTTNTWAGGTLGAMANYGTSPGAVLVPGVNAFVTNSNANGRAVVANSSPVVPVAAASTAGAIQPNNTTAVVVKASAGTLFGVQIYGIGSAPAYVKIYNATSATCGSGTPVKRLMIPAASTAANGAGSNITFGAGLAFSTGITYCVTTGITDADTTAAAANTFLINVDYE